MTPSMALPHPPSTTWAERIFFPALAPSRLALIRIVVGLFALGYLGMRVDMLRNVASADPSLFRPVGVVSWLSAPLPLAVVSGFTYFTLALNLAFVAGWRYRWTGPAFGIALLALLSYRNSWSMVYHSDNAMVIHVLILGLAGAADVFSLDALRRKRSGALAAEDRHWRYGWPVQLISAVTAASYFLSGVAKLASDSGLGWVTGESLLSQIAVDAIRKELLGSSSSAISPMLVEHVWLFTLIGAASLVIELGAPLAVLSPRLGYLWAANAFLMHWGIFFMMAITFRYQMLGIIFLSFLPLERLTRRFEQRALPEPEPLTAAPVVVFDGHCRFCQAQMRLLQGFDLGGQLRYLSLHDGRTRTLLPDLTHEALMREMVVAAPDGRRYAGAQAVRYLSRALPALWPVAPLLHVPGSLPLWRALYRAIARRRYRLAGLACDDGACAWEGAPHAG